MKLTQTLFTLQSPSGDLRVARAQCCMGAVLVAVVGGGVARAQMTDRASVATGGTQGNSLSVEAAFSADGRFVAFSSSATILVANDTNNQSDIFVRDRHSGTTERVNLSSGGAQANSGSVSPSISADGRFVSFTSIATNLVAGDTNAAADIFVRDRELGTTERVSVTTGGVAGNANSALSSISGDGRYVVWETYATNFVAGDTNASPDIFLRDRQLGTTQCVSVSTGGVLGNSNSELPSISGDGRFVTFHGRATNLVALDPNGMGYDVFVRDLLNGTTECVSVAITGNGGGNWPSISGDGRFVAFESGAAGLVANDTNNASDVFLRDRQSGTTERVSVATGGAQGNSQSYEASISADGRFVAFTSTATNLVANDTNSAWDAFLRDRQSGTTVRVSVSTSGVQGNGQSRYPSISGNGRWVAFESAASTLVTGDTNSTHDVFVHDRDAAGFTSLCDAGLAGVIACPCSNAPSGPGRGCDNSFATGGAILSASGVAYLALDSLVFTTSDEKPTATSIVMQGSTPAANGLVFGQGVRCVGGTLKRLYTKTAAGGSITAPDFGAGDPTISARSATLGDTIQAGESRWYLVYYRDPTVLGGCPAASTFNATQTGRIDWSL
jgi:hypothetical protein